MAKPKEIPYVGLDIGTSKVVCVVGLQQEDSSTPSIIGLGVSPTVGLRRGVVIDIEETVSSITAALEEAERMSGIAIERATVSIDGAHIQSLNSRGVIAVARADHQITREDLGRAEEAATAINLDANRQILQVMPRSYTVDGQAGIADPVGMNGVRLEVDTHIITGTTPAIKNVANAVFRSGITIDDQVIAPMAAARAVLTKRQKELGVIVINFGAETTGVVMYEEGHVVFTTILPVGSNHITKDLVYGLRTNIDIAEKVKIAAARAEKGKSGANTKINLEEFGGKGVVRRSEIDKIVLSRLDEIFGMIAGEIKKASKGSLLTAGVVITGGGAHMTGLTDYAKRVLKLPATVGKLSGFSGIYDKINDPMYSAAVGLMLIDTDQPTAHHKIQLGGFMGGVTSKLKSIFKSLAP
ncbi:cell division protein FtsA [Candidatus Saccharibacteria bacterium]|nr:cell division protein FtsA [Candidatus Saccharibacteria bacterium]